MKCCKIFSMVIISLCMIFAGGLFISILCGCLEPDNITMAFIICDFSLIAVIGVLNIIFIIFEEKNNKKVEELKIDALKEKYEYTIEGLLNNVPAFANSTSSHSIAEVMDDCFKAYANAIADI